jgi:Uma2 family endonuclease
MDDVLAKVELTRRRFTVEEYHRMAEAGILTEDDHVELILGEIVQMSPIGHRHAACVIVLNRRLVLALGDRALVSPQSPVRLPLDTEPQPDIVLLRPRDDGYARAPARPEDVLLLVEVADTSYRYDSGVKPSLYARAHIPEVWIVDLEGDAIDVYRRPEGDGYASSERIVRGGTVSPAAFADIVLAVDDELLAR